MQRISRWGLMAVIGTALVLPFGAAVAQDYPKGPVRIVVPYPAGGYTDLLARMLGAGLQARLGQPFVVDNKPGAATAIAAEYVMAAPPDGQTLLMTTVTTLALNPLTIKDLRYKSEQFVPVALVARQPFMLVASLTFPPNNPKELIAYAKANPGKINWATQGQAGSSQLRGRAPEVARRHRHGRDPLQRQCTGQHRHHGRARRRALRRRGHVAAQRRQQEGEGDRRHVARPDGRAPRTFPRSSRPGLPGMVAYSWYGIVAPPGTPPAVIDKLNAGNRSLGARKECPKSRW